MVDSAGDPIAASPTFRVLRDRLPSTIAALEARRGAFEALFRELKQVGVGRRSLQLAFDFSVRNRTQLHQRILTLREEALGWLAGLAPDHTSGFQNVTATDFGDCSDPAQTTWRKVSGEFLGPYYMDGACDPLAE